MAELETTVDLVRDIAPKVTMTVKITSVKKWHVRMWIGAKLIRLAARIMNMGVKIEDIDGS